jgi:hypothetical protein
MVEKRTERFRIIKRKAPEKEKVFGKKWAARSRAGRR